MLCGELDATSAGISIFLLLDVIFIFLRHFPSPTTEYKSEKMENKKSTRTLRDMA